MTPTIVNVRGVKPNAPAVFYCGREFAGWTGSPLGNPFREPKHGTRAEVIQKYRGWLAGKILAKDPEVLAAMCSIKPDSRLGCWCAPEPCHCEVIVEFWKEHFYKGR